MKLNKTQFWISIIIIWTVEIILLVAGRENEREISSIRLVGLLVVLLVYLLAIIFRLNDCGKSRWLMLLCFFIPFFMIWIGIQPSENHHSVKVNTEKDVEI